MQMWEGSLLQRTCLLLPAKPVPLTGQTPQKEDQILSYPPLFVHLPRRDEGAKREEVAHTDHFPQRKDLAGVCGCAQRPFGSSCDPARMLESKPLVFKDSIYLF